MQETFIWGQTEWTVTGVHQIFDGFLTLIRERILPYIEVTVKPLLSFCTFWLRNKWLGPFSISNKYVGPVLTLLCSVSFLYQEKPEKQRKKLFYYIKLLLKIMQTPGGIFWGNQKPCPGSKFFCKITAPGTRRHLPPGSILKGLVSFSCWSASKFWNFAEIKP